MMQGYDIDKAVAFMLSTAKTADYPSLIKQLPALFRAAIEADTAYMLSTKVLSPEGLMGEAYYDDDDAFEFIFDRLVAQQRPTGKAKDDLASFVDQYLELQQSFMEQSGLLGWD